MLIVGDLHITSRYKDQILSNIQNWIDQYPDENTIIFLGDYVYHFSYDRNALLALYQMFISLFERGKTVYILAGNHDRLGDSFVFEEAQKAFSLLEKYKVNHVGQLKFVTEANLETIDGEQILLLPYTIKTLNISPTNQPLWLQNISYLQESTNKNEQRSREINACLASYLEQNPNLFVIHHHYFNNTIFPGQKSRFSYKDTALSEQLLDMPNIKFLSGHLHQGFSAKNYLCTGSVRSTSSLETNQQKYLFYYNSSDKSVQATPISINPYIQIDMLERQKNLQGMLLDERAVYGLTLDTSSSNEVKELMISKAEQCRVVPKPNANQLFETVQDNPNTEILTKSKIQNQIENIILSNQSNFTSQSRPIVFQSEKTSSLNTVSLSIKVDNLDYDKLNDYIDPALIPQLKDIKLKKSFDSSSSEMIEKLKISSFDLKSFADWKHILKSYLTQKFGDDYVHYEKLLHELKVL